MTHKGFAHLTIERFESGNIDPARFDHEAHIYVAWLYLANMPKEQAVEQFDSALRRFTRKIGAEQKYNAMITWLFLLLIAERRRDGEDWVAFRARNDDLFKQRPNSQAA
jgi:hypothetical protein